MNKIGKAIMILLGSLLIGTFMYIETGNVNAYITVRADTIQEDSHSNDSVTNPVSWNDWQKNPKITLNVDTKNLSYGDRGNRNEDTFSYDMNGEGDTIVTGTLGDRLSEIYSIPSEELGIRSISIDGVPIPEKSVEIEPVPLPYNEMYTKVTVPLDMVTPKVISSEQPNRSIKFIVDYTTNPSSYAATIVSPLRVLVPQLIRVFYKDAQTGKSIKSPVLIGKGMKMGDRPIGDIVAPAISGYTLKMHNGIQKLSADVNDDLEDKAIMHMIKVDNPGQSDAEYDLYFRQFKGILQMSLGDLPLLESVFGYVESSFNKNWDVYQLLSTKSDTFQDGSSVSSPKLTNYPQAIVFWYDKNKAPSPSPSPNPTPTPNPQPTPTPAPNPQPATPVAPVTPVQPSNPVIPNYAAKKGAAVYGINSLYLYKKANFTKGQRIAKYVKKPRMYRPMFVVTDYARSITGKLRYKVTDVNHRSKTAGKSGYVTASWKYVRPVYYASKHSKITVISPKGVNAYKTKALTGKVKNYKQGTVLNVKGMVKHNLTTRYILTNGKYVTANRKLVNMGRHETVKKVRAKTTINRYKNVNLSRRNQTFKKGKVFKVYNYDYSHGYNLQKHGTLRYHVAGGYITGNSKYVKVIR